MYNCLKRANIHTLLDLLSKTEEDLMRIDSFRMEDENLMWATLESISQLIYLRTSSRFKSITNFPLFLFELE
jgi:DNA-directed RNA polymerase alpha subunit